MFFGNKNLRKVGEKIDYNQQMLNEIIKCREDIIYFAENYFYIVHPDRGKIKIDLYDWQKKILKSCVETPDDRRHLIIRIPRQQGKCFSKESKIRVRNKKTGEIISISAEDFYKKMKKT